MPILPITARKALGPIEIHLTQEANDAVSKLETRLDALTDEYRGLAKAVARNRRAVLTLLDFFAQHAPVFDDAKVTTIKDLAAMTANDRRSAYAKMTKSQAWSDADGRTLSKAQFDEICEMAKTLVEE